MRFSRLFCIGGIAFSAALMSQDLPGCEIRPEVRKALHELYTPAVEKLTLAEREAMRDRVIAEVIARYPREAAPHVTAIDYARYQNPGRKPHLLTQYRQMATVHPDDAFALYLAANAVNEVDTAESIRLAESARAKSPGYAPPALLLARIYSAGLRADKEKFGRNLRAYYSLCPSATNGTYLLSKLADPALQTSIAVALRRRLSASSDLRELSDFDALWGLEFRNTPPAGHAALRKQVADDVKRLELLNPKPDSAYFNTLRSGYKQSGASKETLTAFEDRIIKDAPTSYLAYSIAAARWSKENKEPEDQTDRAAWQAYTAKRLTIAAEWEARFADVTFLRESRVYTMFESDTVTEKQGLAEIEAVLAHHRVFDRTDASQVARLGGLLLDRKWRPERALELFLEARQLLPESERLQLGSDNLTAAQREEETKYFGYTREWVQRGILQSALLASKPEAAEVVRAEVEAPLVKDAKGDKQSAYWLNRARLAQLDKHPADALTYYQRALISRDEAPKMMHGLLKDPLIDESKDLWKQLNGTETAWAEWSKPPISAKAEEAKQGRWEKPGNELPAFELSDLSGKTWRLKALEGKTVLINLWATWCGPCREELPQLQKLYDHVKGRSDLQVISFNIDSELGLVAPYMQEKGYTFPVLMAFDFTQNLLDMIAIPQNWVVDGKGKWQWTQLGYGAEPDWPGEMLKRLEATTAR